MNQRGKKKNELKEMRTISETKDGISKVEVRMVEINETEWKKRKKN